eukprot:310664-Chlamydomonas_euryale.AAC.6
MHICAGLLHDRFQTGPQPAGQVPHILLKHGCTCSWSNAPTFHHADHKHWNSSALILMTKRKQTHRAESIRGSATLLLDASTKTKKCVLCRAASSVRTKHWQRVPITPTPKHCFQGGDSKAYSHQTICAAAAAAMTWQETCAQSIVSLGARAMVQEGRCPRRGTQAGQAATRPWASTLTGRMGCQAGPAGPCDAGRPFSTLQRGRTGCPADRCVACLRSGRTRLGARATPPAVLLYAAGTQR